MERQNAGPGAPTTRPVGAPERTKKSKVKRFSSCQGCGFCGFIARALNMALRPAIRQREPYLAAHRELSETVDSPLVSKVADFGAQAPLRIGRGVSLNEA